MLSRRIGFGDASFVLDRTRTGISQRQTSCMRTLVCSMLAVTSLSLSFCSLLTLSLSLSPSSGQSLSLLVLTTDMLLSELSNGKYVTDAGKVDAVSLLLSHSSVSLC